MLTELQGKTVTVYCASSTAVPSVYFEAARKLGTLMGQHGMNMVYGGANIGLMGAVADAAMSAGSRVIGVIPVFFSEAGLAHPNLHELILTDGMRERKTIMEERADAFITLPGGYGTLEEIFEILTLKQLGFHHKPIVLLNTDDYYAPLLTLLQRATEQHFMKPHNLEYFHVAPTPEDALQYIATYQPTPFEVKWSPPRPSQSRRGEVPGTE
jgi:cytokinin riboside 5'-monophosphate phosphoribohydrolase